MDNTVKALFIKSWGEKFPQNIPLQNKRAELLLNTHNLHSRSKNSIPERSLVGGSMVKFTLHVKMGIHTEN